MTTVNRYIEEIEDETLQTQQMGYYPAEEAGRNRTRARYQDSTTGESDFLNEEEIDDKISDAISSAIGTSGTPVAVAVTTEAELTAALENAAVIDIWCKRVTLTFSSTQTVDVTSSKNIYGGEGDFILPSAMADYRINFPTSGGSANITISFYVPITGGNAGLGAYGGYVGSPTYKIRYKHSKDARFNSATNVTAQYESCDASMSSANDLVMWSGSNSTGRTDSDTSITPTENNILATSKSTNPTAYADYGMMASVGYNTPGLETHALKFITEDDPDGNTQLKWTPFIDGTYSKFETKLSNVLSSTLNSRGQLALGDFGLDPWDEVIDLVQLGQYASHYSFEDSGGDKRSGVAQHCYAQTDTGTWKFSTASVYAQRFETVDGVYTEYVSNATGSVDGTITWVEVFKRDENGNTAKNGASIPATLESLFAYEFNGNACRMSTKSSGSVIDCNNCYYDGTVWKSIANTGAYCSYASLTPTVYSIRQSTAVASSAGQTMTMTTVITPS